MKRLGIFLCFIFVITDAQASQRAQLTEGNNYYKKQRWDKAVERYLDALEYPEHTDIVRYNLGTAFYKEGNYDQAIEHLLKMTGQSDSLLSAKAHYNVGNAFYKKALTLEEEKIDEALTFMQKALEHFQQALILKPKDDDARFNRNRAQEEIDRLKKKQEEKNRQKNQQQDQQKDNKSSSGKDNNEQKESSADQKSSDHKEASSADKQEDKSNEAGSTKEQESSAAQEQGGQQQKTAESAIDNAAGQEPLLKEAEAREILEEYERKEAPKGIIHFVNRHQGESHVERDW